MSEKIFNWFENRQFNQGEYTESKINEFEQISIQRIKDTEEIGELKF